MAGERAKNPYSATECKYNVLFVKSEKNNENEIRSTRFIRRGLTPQSVIHIFLNYFE